jgi:hypothetical protein
MQYGGYLWMQRIMGRSTGLPLFVCDIDQCGLLHLAAKHGFFANIFALVEVDDALKEEGAWKRYPLLASSWFYGVNTSRHVLTDEARYRRSDILASAG